MSQTLKSLMHSHKIGRAYNAERQSSFISFDLSRMKDITEGGRDRRNPFIYVGQLIK